MPERTFTTFGRRFGKIAAGLGRIGHIRSDMPSLDGAAPDVVQEAAISPLAGPPGTQFTLIPPIVEGGPIPTVSLFSLTLDGADVLPFALERQVAPAAAGELVAVWKAANGVPPVAISTARATVTQAQGGGFSSGFNAGFDRG